MSFKGLKFTFVPAAVKRVSIKNRSFKYGFRKIHGVIYNDGLTNDITCEQYAFDCSSFDTVKIRLEKLLFAHRRDRPSSGNQTVTGLVFVLSNRVNAIMGAH